MSNQLKPFERLNLERILTNHFQRFRHIQIEDMYKLIHQGTMGSEHAIKNANHAREWLEKEIATLNPSPNEPLIDPISADKAIVRINLRPFLEIKGDPEELLHWFIQTANEHKGSHNKLMSSWQVFEEMVRNGDQRFELPQLSKFIHKMQSYNFPAIHHSMVYQRLYRPAYRVVATNLIPRSWFDKFTVIL